MSEDKYIDVTLRLPPALVEFIQTIARMADVSEDDAASVMAALGIAKMNPDEVIEACVNASLATPAESGEPQE